MNIWTTIFSLASKCLCVHLLTRTFLSCCHFKILDVIKQKSKTHLLVSSLQFPAVISPRWQQNTVQSISPPLTWRTDMNILQWLSAALLWWITTLPAILVIRRVRPWGKRRAPVWSGLPLATSPLWHCTVSRRFCTPSSQRVRGAKQDPWSPCCLSPGQYHSYL